jgi:archaellin
MRFIFIISVLFHMTAFSQQNATISGTVREAASGEEVIGAIIRVKNNNIGDFTP